MTASQSVASPEPVVPVMTMRVRPFLGSLVSCAFKVRDEEAFADDPAIASLIQEIDVLRGKREEDVHPMFCLARDMSPSAPLFVERAAGLTLLDDQGPELAEVIDVNGWVAALRRHLDPSMSLVVQEYLNPDARGLDLFWVILAEAAVCGINSAYRECARWESLVFLRQSGAAE